MASGHSSTREHSPPPGRSVGPSDTHDSHDVDSAHHRSSQSHARSSKQHVSYPIASHSSAYSHHHASYAQGYHPQYSDYYQQASFSHEDQSLPLHAAQQQQSPQQFSDQQHQAQQHQGQPHQGQPHFTASSPQAVDTAEQIKSVIAKLASEAVDKRADAVFRTPRDQW